MLDLLHSQSYTGSLTPTAYQCCTIMAFSNKCQVTSINSKVWWNMLASVEKQEMVGMVQKYLDKHKESIKSLLDDEGVYVYQ